MHNGPRGLASMMAEHIRNTLDPRSGPFGMKGVRSMLRRLLKSGEYERIVLAFAYLELLQLVAHDQVTTRDAEQAATFLRQTRAGCVESLNRVYGLNVDEEVVFYAMSQMDAALANLEKAVVEHESEQLA